MSTRGGPTLAQQRFRLMLKQIEEARGRGWQAELAPRLGVHQTMLSKIAGGEREAGVELIESAINALEVDRDFFFDRGLGPDPDHAKFTRVPRTRVERDDAVLRVVEEFIASLEPEELAEFDRLGGREWGEGITFAADAMRRLGTEPSPSLVRRLWSERRAQLLGKIPVGPRVQLPIPPGKKALGRKRRES